MRFQNGSNKVVIELRVVQFWSEIILVISNRTRAARSFDFEIEFQTKYCTPLSSITIIITCKKAVRLHNAQTKISGPFLESSENLLDPKSHV